MARAHNFNAGPAALPQPVLEQAQAELLEFGDNGMSVMEMSHRAKGFDAVIEAAEANIRKLMGVPDDYAVLFLQGGASLQFAMIPLNLLAKGQTADYVHTGSWAKKAIAEGKLVGDVNVAWDGKSDNYMRMPKAEELAFSSNAAYVHITSNETIEGIQYKSFPKTGAPLIADMSSDILSRPLDVTRFGLIYAGAQKNIGPSGMALVVMRKDLAARAPASLNTFLKYDTHIEKGSRFNTPNTWAIYLVKLFTQWIEAQGGVAKLAETNAAKADTLYAVLDSSDFWQPCAQRESRSQMNVTWRLQNEDLESTFVAEATAAGLVGLKGHRSVGGLRASIYNACPLLSVKALASFMKDFERKHG